MKRRKPQAPRGKHPNSLKNLKPVKKGEVRNPKGINRKRPLTERLYENIEEPLSASIDGEKLRRAMDLPPTATWADIVNRRMIREAARGNVRAYSRISDMLEGKPTERIEISTPTHSEITIRLKDDRERPTPSSDESSTPSTSRER